MFNYNSIASKLLFTEVFLFDRVKRVSTCCSVLFLNFLEFFLSMEELLLTSTKLFDIKSLIKSPSIF